MTQEAPKAQKAEQPLPAIMMHNQYIKDMSLEIPHAPEIFNRASGQPEIKIDVDINARNLQKNFFCVDMTFRIDGDFKDEKFFILEMTYSGIVSLNVPKEHVEPVLMIEIPHMLFPYARQAVSNTLFNGGLPPLMLTPIDFVALYQARKQKQASAEPQPDK